MTKRAKLGWVSYSLAHVEGTRPCITVYRAKDSKIHFATVWPGAVGADDYWLVSFEGEQAASFKTENEAHQCVVDRWEAE